jgi:two-component sensor histidine kinase
MTERIAFSLHGGAEAGCAARAAVDAADGAVPASVREDVLLLVTELVTNAVRHGGVGPDQAVRVRLARRTRSVRVEVAHPGNGFEHDPAPPPPDAAGGWGLLLVDRIADSWGITKGSSGTCVWFELRSHA